MYQSLLHLKTGSRDFPDCPLVKTPCFECRDPGLIPGQATRSHRLRLSSYATIKDPACCN